MSNASVTCLSIALLGAYACSNDTRFEPSEPGKEVASNAEVLTGQVVSVRGSIGDVFGERAFAMEAKAGESEAGLDASEMLVLANVPITVSSRGLTNADDVIVRGKIWKFDRSALHEQLGWNPLHLEEAYDGEPVVIAESVTMAAEPMVFWNDPYQGQ